MDGLIFALIVKETWERLDVIAIVSILTLLSGATGGMLAMYVRYRIDRERLTNLELDKEKNQNEFLSMRQEFEEHKKENIETFKEIRESIHTSNQQVLEKVDELKMYLLHSKITIKGKQYEKE